MSESPLSPHSASPAELRDRIRAERDGLPFVVYRDTEGGHHLEVLDGERVTIGRDPSNTLPLEWDPEVSRAHAELLRVGSRWTVVDDGLSRNGSFVNGDRVAGRRVLADGDVMRFGATTVAFCDPQMFPGSTISAAEAVTVSALSQTQQKVLKALCQPLLQRDGFAAPASNPEIAERLFLSVEAIKKQLHALFEKFEIDDLPQNQKRARLAEIALRSGLVSSRDAD